jgi:hypothetical protein
VNDGVEPLDIVRRYITNVPSPLFIASRLDAKVTSVVPTDIEADNLVLGCSQEWNQYCTDVAAVAVDEHAHNSLLELVLANYEILWLQDQ